jgi:hypothetical protein
VLGARRIRVISLGAIRQTTNTKPPWRVPGFSLGRGALTVITAGLDWSWVLPVPRLASETVDHLPALDCRVLSAVEAHAVLDTLPIGKTPSFSELISGQPKGSSDDTYGMHGWRLEAFVADELLRCREGRLFENIVARSARCADGPRGARMARVVVAFECFLNRKGIISVVAGRVLSRQVVGHTFIIAQAIGLIALIPKNQRWGNAQLGDRRYSSVAAIECSGSPASTEPKAVAQKTGLQALADTINSLLPKEGVHFF